MRQSTITATHTHTHTTTAAKKKKKRGHRSQTNLFFGAAAMAATLLSTCRLSCALRNTHMLFNASSNDIDCNHASSKSWVGARRLGLGAREGHGCVFAKALTSASSCHLFGCRSITSTYSWLISQAKVERERQRETERETERQRDRETERERETETETETERQRERDRERSVWKDTSCEEL